VSEAPKREEPKVVYDIPPQQDTPLDLQWERVKELLLRGRAILHERDERIEPPPPEPPPKPRTQSDASLLDIVAAIPLCIIVFKLSSYGAASVLYQMPIPYSYADSLSWIPAIVIAGLFVGFIWLITKIKLKQERRTKPELIAGWVLLILAVILAYYFFLYIYPVGWFYPEIFTLAVALFLFICRKGFFYLFEAQPSQN
jgi:hypothetical protein